MVLSRTITHLSVIITTYNQPEWLEKTLVGFENQSLSSFEVIIADDGSDKRTQDVIDRFRTRGRLDIRHVWHPDTGFNKCSILNQSIAAAKYDYLLFTDGDCIPRRDFVEVHLSKAEKGRFLSGGYFKLSTPVSHQLTVEDIVNQRPFKAGWLVSQGQPRTYKMLKFVNRRWLETFFNRATVTKATWNGHNVSGWKQDIIDVNGYNEDMQYGGLDRELGERLENNGIRGKQIRYSAICVHLDHPRPYRTTDTLSKNRAIRDRVKREKITWAKVGIKK